LIEVIRFSGEEVWRVDAYQIPYYSRGIEEAKRTRPRFVDWFQVLTDFNQLYETGREAIFISWSLVCEIFLYRFFSIAANYLLYHNMRWSMKTNLHVEFLTDFTSKLTNCDINKYKILI
jgi:hypothetical protein